MSKNQNSYDTTSGNDGMMQESVNFSSELMEILSSIHDPEIPVINIVELGIIREATLSEVGAVITITPTYSGCPAMEMIQGEIHRVLAEHGMVDVTIKTVYAPPWSTDWISDSAKEKLRSYGISPPGQVHLSPLLQIDLPVVHCPLCGSSETAVTSEFGSTACKSYHKCHSCSQPFEHFKPF